MVLIVYSNWTLSPIVSICKNEYLSLSFFKSSCNRSYVYGSFVLTEDDDYENSIIKLETDHGNFFVVDDSKDKKDSTKIIPIWKDSTTMPQVGYDPLTKQFNYNLFCQLLADNPTTVEKLIKNPLILSGIGDTYGDMILKKASITKKTKTSEINKAKAREIFDAIKQVLREASGNTEEEESDSLEE